MSRGQVNGKTSLGRSALSEAGEYAKEVESEEEEEEGEEPCEESGKELLAEETTEE